MEETLPAGLTTQEPIQYHPLSESSNDIRVLSFEYTRDSDGNIIELPIESNNIHQDAIRLHLEHVSLDDWRHDYASFVEKNGHTTHRGGAYPWMRKVIALHDDLDPTSPESHHECARFTWGDFAALSYQWNPVAPRKTVFINEKAVEVGLNLEAALRHLRHQPLHKGGYKIWADAICINQADRVERSVQVKCMKQIYSDAITVHLWIGMPDATLSRAFAFFEGCGELPWHVSEEAEKMAEELVRSGRLADYEPATTTSVESSVNIFDSSLDYRERLELTRDMANSIFQSSYWTRVWILQEILLSPDWVEVHCGRFSLQLLCLARFMTSCAYLADEVGAPRLRIEPKHGGHAIGLSLFDAIGNWQKHNIMGNDHPERMKFLSRVILLARGAHATEPPDKVYGILGLLPTEISTKITVDYDRPVEETYLEFIQLLLVASGNLDLLWSSPQDLNTFLPSWMINLQTMTGYGANPAGPLFNASQRRSSRISCIEENKILACQGFQVDVIDGVSAFSKASAAFEFSILNIADFPDSSDIQQTTGRVAAYEDEASLRLALSSAIYFGGYFPNSTPPEFDAEQAAHYRSIHNEHLESVFNIPILPLDDIFDEQLAIHQELYSKGWSDSLESGSLFRVSQFLQANAEFQIFDRSLETFFSPEIQAIGGHTNPGIIIDFAAGQVASGRRIITTQAGMIGSASPAVQSGDLVYILLGSSFPVILRPHEDCFKIVGTVFIRDLMDGEAFEWLESGCYTLSEIKLC